MLAEGDSVVAAMSEVSEGDSVVGAMSEVSEESNHRNSAECGGSCEVHSRQPRKLVKAGS